LSFLPSVRLQYFPDLLYILQFIEDTFALAQPNLRVNGRNFEDLDDNEEGGRFPTVHQTASQSLQEMECFDEVLDREVWCLSDQRLKSDSGIADKRRDKPKQIESAFRDYLRSQEQLETEERVSSVQQDSRVDENGTLFVPLSAGAAS